MHCLKITIIAIVISAIFCSCAAPYKGIDPGNLTYTTSGDDAPLSYKYDILQQTNNKKYAKKEARSKIKVVAIRIINNTGQSLSYSNNYKIYNGNKEIQLLPVSEVTQSIRQTIPTYLLYLLLTPARFTVYTESSESHTPVGFVLGPGLAAVNVLIAAKANSNFRKEMEAYNITAREIKSGETVFGLIAIKSTDYMPLSIKIIK